MDNWYTVEHQIRERLTGLREAARIWALTHDRTSTPRRMRSARTTIIRLAKWALGSHDARARMPTSPSRRRNTAFIKANVADHNPNVHLEERACDTN